MGQKHIKGQREHNVQFMRSALKPLMPSAWDRHQCTRCWNQSGPVWEQNSGDFNGPPPLQRMSLDVRLQLFFTLVGRVCCVSTCLTSGAAHAQRAHTWIPFVVSYRSARKHVNMRACSKDGVFPRTPGGATLTAVPVRCHFITGRRFFFCRFACFWGAAKCVQPLFLETICQLTSPYGFIILSLSYDWTALAEPFTVSRSVTVNIIKLVSDPVLHLLHAHLHNSGDMFFQTSSNQYQ